MKNDILKISFICLVILLLQSCFSVHTTHASKIKKVYETFFAGEQGHLYFIKPMLFQTKEKEQSFWDFTFHSNDTLQGQVKVNFSIYTPTSVRKIENVIFSNQAHNFSTNEIHFMFVERQKVGFVSRFTLNMEIQAFKNFFSNPNGQIQVRNSDKIYSYQPNTSTIKKMKVVELLLQDL